MTAHLPNVGVPPSGGRQHEKPTTPDTPNSPVPSAEPLAPVPSPNSMSWQFWIDVGGTFTDCFGKGPDGTLLRHKLLSSGVTKGSVGTGSDRSRIIDPVRSGDPQGFWTGYGLRLLDADGNTVGQSTVAGFDQSDGTLRTDPR